MANYDVLGSIALLKFDNERKGVSKKQKLKQAKELLKRKNIKTVLEKSNKVSGRLRTIKTKYLLGVKTLEAKHKESGCVFKLNVETCYFSQRLAEERKQVAEIIKNEIKKNKIKNSKILVLFSGVIPFPVIIQKIANPKELVSIELSRQCYKYALENEVLNKIKNKIEIIQGDVKKEVPKLARKKKKFDFIVMPRPNLKETFLKEAFSVSKSGTMVFYYCFGRKKELNKQLEEIYKTAKQSKKKIKVLKVKTAGDIAPYKFRYRVDLKVI